MATKKILLNHQPLILTSKPLDIQKAPLVTSSFTKHCTRLPPSGVGQQNLKANLYNRTNHPTFGEDTQLGYHTPKSDRVVMEGTGWDHRFESKGKTKKIRVTHDVRTRSEKKYDVVLESKIKPRVGHKHYTKTSSSVSLFTIL